MPPTIPTPPDLETVPLEDLVGPLLPGEADLPDDLPDITVPTIPNDYPFG